MACKIAVNFIQLVNHLFAKAFCCFTLYYIDDIPMTGHKLKLLCMHIASYGVKHATCTNTPSLCV